MTALHKKLPSVVHILTEGKEMRNVESNVTLNSNYNTFSVIFQAQDTRGRLKEKLVPIVFQLGSISILVTWTEKYVDTFT